MFELSLSKLLVILILALLIFGAKRLPEIASSAAKSVVAFKKGLREIEDNISKETDSTSSKEPETKSKKKKS